MNCHRLIFSTLFCLIGISMFAQRGIVKQANKYFAAEKYLEALELYDKVDEKDQDKYLLFKRGVSNYYSSNSDQAIADLTMSRRLGYEEKEIYLYAAKALHSKNQFSDASRFYKNYLRYLDKKEEKLAIIELIKQCRFGIDNQYNDQIAFVENLGTSVNTEFDEFNPIQSPTSQNKYYFSSNRSGSNGGLRNSQGYKDEIYGKYSSDMYAVELSDGNWTPVSAFYPILNGPKNDIIECFNTDGSVMYFLKSQDGKTGQMFADTFSIDKDPEVFPKQFSSPVISELGDKDLQVFNNNTLIFSSKRKGGFGGYDLYISLKKENGWEEPINLGPEINTKFDEVSPFLTKSGTKLYFSSDRISSFGGFDIYASTLNYQTLDWFAPENLGVPINSSMNDMGFSISSDGMTAIFSSNRPDSYGGSDLYLAYLKTQVTEQLMYTELIPFVMEESEDVVAEESNQEESNSESTIVSEPIIQKEFINSPLYYGSDEIILNPSNSGKMKRVKDLMTIYPELKITFLGHSIKEGMREFDLYFTVKRSEKAADYLIQNGIDASRISVKGLGSNFPHTLEENGKINRLAEKNNRRIDLAFNDVPADRLRVIEERPSVSEGLKDNRFETYLTTVTNLSYKIQVAKTKQMYKADVIRQYDSGIVGKRMDEDSYTYTIGVFETYSQARNLKRELLRKGIIDAKVIPYVNSKSINLEQIQVLKETYSDLNEYLRFETE